MAKKSKSHLSVVDKKNPKGVLKHHVTDAIERDEAEAIVEIPAPKPKPTPTTIAVNAELFRIAALCVSSDETRYYLGGVYCEPHPVVDVNLVATDGRHLLHIHDALGRADKAEIIRLSPATLKACKPAKPECRRELRIDLVGHGAQVFAIDREATEKEPELHIERPVGVETNVIIDGTFPAYRRVVPANMGEKRTAAGFDGHLLTAFATIGPLLGRALARDAQSKSHPDGIGMVVHCDGEGPALILWDAITSAYGVLMPLRCDDHAMAGKMPSFFSTGEPAAEAAA